MGGCLSCRSLPYFDVIRVVHFSGFVEDFDRPVTAGEITGNPPKYFLFSSTEFCSSFTSTQALLPNIQLQRGHLYFLLPLSTLRWEASPIDFACLATRLTKVAKRCGSKSRHSQSSSVLDLLPTTGRSKSTTKRVGSWKPILETISERSFGLRSESDLHYSPILQTPSIES